MGTLKNPTECLCRGSPTASFIPPEHLCDVTYTTEMSSTMTLNNIHISPTHYLFASITSDEFHLYLLLLHLAAHNEREAREKFKIKIHKQRESNLHPFAVVLHQSTTSLPMSNCVSKSDRDSCHIISIRGNINLIMVFFSTPSQQ